MEKICRGCLSANVDYLQSIFEDNLAELFQTITSLQISKNDGLPIYICMCCTNRLFEYNNFKTQCVSSDEQLRKRLKLEPKPVIDLTEDSSRNTNSKNATKLNKSSGCALPTRYVQSVESTNKSKPFMLNATKENGNSDAVSIVRRLLNEITNVPTLNNVTPKLEEVEMSDASRPQNERMYKMEDDDYESAANNIGFDFHYRNLLNGRPVSLDLIGDLPKSWNPRVIVRRLHVDYDPQRKSYQGTYNCGMCKRMFDDEDEFEFHMQEHQLEKINAVPNIKCEMELDINDYISSSQVSQFRNSNTVNMSNNIYISSSDDECNEVPVVSKEVISSSRTRNDNKYAELLDSPQPLSVRGKRFVDYLRSTSEDCEFRCRICGQVFKQAIQYVEHYKQMHKVT